MSINEVKSGEMRQFYPLQAKAAGAKEESLPVISDGFSSQETGKDPTLDALNSMMKGDAKIRPDVQTKQYADSYGQIKHLALMISSSYAGGNIRKQMLDAYKVLFQNMEPDTKFSMVVETDRDRKDVEKAMKESGMQNPERVQFIKPDAAGLTVWARDMMIGMYDQNNPDQQVLLNQTMLHNWHADDVKVPKAITDANPNILLDVEPRIRTDGGDTVSNTKESFWGYYSVAATAQNLAHSVRSSPGMKDKVIEFYENNFNTRVEQAKSDEEIFPFKFVPVEYPREIHRNNFKMVENPSYREMEPKRGTVSEGQMYEDLAMKLAEQQFGKPIVPMGKDDPATQHKEEPASDHLDMSFTPVDDKTIFVGDPKLFKELLSSMNKEELQHAEKTFSEIAGRKIDLKSYIEDSRNRDNPEDFAAYVKTATEKGYDVKRMPHSEPSFGTPYISYNNCLMERFDKNGDGNEYRRVFLPTFGIPKIDNYAINNFKSEGFEVFPMELGALSARWGAIRCISNWLERSPQG
jgi:hypothetical protein